jgi:ATP-binding cassette subfamily B protein
MKYHQQSDITDCGPACLAMIASAYKSFVTIGQARELCKTDTIGTNFAGMIAAAEKLGFDTKPLRGEVRHENIDAELIFPFIAHVNVLIDGAIYTHYVVVKNVTKKYIEIWDPDPLKGKYKSAREEFLKIWTGYILLMTPSIVFSPEKGKGNVLLKFLPLLLPHKKTLIVTSIASILLIIFGIATSFYYKYIIDEVIIAKATGTLTTLSIGILLITITQTIIEALRGSLLNYFSYKTDTRLNFSYISHILKLPFPFFDSRKTGEILSRLNDIENIRGALSSTLLSVIIDSILIFVIGPILFKTNSVLFVVLFLNVIIISIIMFSFAKLFRKYYTRLRNEEAQVNATLVETIGGAYTVKALSAEKTVFDVYEKSRMRAVWAGWQTARMGIAQNFLTEIIGSVCSIVIFWLGSSSIIKDTMSFGSLISFNALSAYFTGPLLRLVNLQPSLQEAYVAAERVNEILELTPEQNDEEKYAIPVSLEGNIDFSNVLFKYGMRYPVYKNLSIHIENGQWVGIAGPSGCGKTTLAKLLLKFYTPENGTICINNHDIRDIDVLALRSRIGYVPQDIVIFSGTIAENIALHNPDTSLEDIVEAAKKAGADEFIDRLPERYNTRLSERGTTLSGGERQRLALARALLGKPDIMILDEATSNLDSISERSVHQAIESLRGSITTIIIAHRLTTIKTCDVIFVMDKGDIVESGSHVELLARNGLYKSLWENVTV